MESNNTYTATMHEDETKIYFPELKIKYHRDKYPIFNYKLEQHGNFVDLATAEPVRLNIGEFALISLGVSIKLPEGYWGQVVPRSSTFKKYGIIMANSFGVIDTEYCGEEDIWRFPAFATRDIVIPANERICQFRIVKDVGFYIKEVDNMEDSNRGGFGSSDKKVTLPPICSFEKLDVNPEFDPITKPIKIKGETTYCVGCESAYLCFGVDTEQCESYKERKRKAEDKNNN